MFLLLSGLGKEGCCALVVRAAPNATIVAKAASAPIEYSTFGRNFRLLTALRNQLGQQIDRQIDRLSIGQGDGRAACVRGRLLRHQHARGFCRNVRIPRLARADCVDDGRWRGNDGDPGGDRQEQAHDLALAGALHA